MDATVPGAAQHDGPAPYEQTAAERGSLARRRLVVGAIWLILGVLVTVITYANAAGGGIYVVAWGPMIFGVFRIVQGLWTATQTS
ncbi:hypothetical protein [Actinomycetospora termitidis]|uniref:Uncharacterized protein n=1 Tax=Actinomycetospora termitidis TaxID=3053470 RepID=A0ABT7ME09_9PSEU|nr:hypothetical protein [Actinomycetospora sp. Odt1-22]MDL5158901.1 hypothetical protein [Actinomycetospora sp. Odt1-22]